MASSDSPVPAPRLTIAIAGATGFVGQALVEALRRRHRVVGLTRSRERAAQPTHDSGLEWRACDLYSLRSTEDALAGADCAIYLVHSMLPSARLTQASFEDLDLVLADNFARAAEHAGVSQILYVGGLTPEGEELSPHLESRLEVERTLASRKVPLTALRAGMIVGPGGSSLSILVNLVRRLPAMVLPRWTESLTQPVALRDVVRAVEFCVGNPEARGATFDIGGPDVITYRELLARTAEVLGVKRPMIGVPWFSPRLSRLWVSLFSGASGALVGPLIESLRHDMVADDNPLQRRIAPGSIPFEAALRESEVQEGSGSHSRWRLFSLDRWFKPMDHTVRSVQRMILPRGHDARWVAEEYQRFLPRFGGGWLLNCEVEGERCRFYLRGTRLMLLELQRDPVRSQADRQLFQVVGGFLVKRLDGPLGRLEFREVLERRFVMAAVHDFRPALPWLLYRPTHAQVHLLVMRRFGRHLGRLSRLAEGERKALPAGAGS